MKYFKDENNKVYAYESDGSQDAWIKPNLIPITEQEADELRKPPAMPPSGDYIQENDQWVKTRYTKKDFMLWVGMEKIIAVNAAISNPLIKTIHDLLMAAEYISLRDPATQQMLSMLASPSCGDILTMQDVERILAGEVWIAPEAE